MEGADILAILNKLLMRFAPTPTYISAKSEPEAKKRLALTSLAKAFANIVLPTPGSPVRRMPRGTLSSLSSK